MHKLLVWPCSQTIKIIVHADQVDLSTITSCDHLNISVLFEQQLESIDTQITGCQIPKIRQKLTKLADREIHAVHISPNLKLSIDHYDNVLVELSKNGQPWLYQLQDLATIVSWVAQLKLLEIVMQENAEEKKQKGTGCCS